jgi:hypothetical protein
MFRRQQTYATVVKLLEKQDVPGGKVNILGGHSNGHSKHKHVCVHVAYSESQSQRQSAPIWG